MSEDTSVREDLFIAGVVAGKSLTQAAIDAGYSERSATQYAHQLMKRPGIAQAIQAGKERVLKAHRVTVDRTLEELSVIGFSDLAHYTVDGKPITDWLGLTADAPKNALRAIKKVKRKPVSITVVSTEGGIEERVAFETEIEFWSKDTATKHLGDYLKLFKEKRADDEPEDEITDDELREGVISILKEAKKRKDAARRKNA